MIPTRPAYPFAEDLLGQALTADEGQALLDNPPPLEYLDSTRLGGGPAFYDYQLHLLCGHKKSGKSWISMMQALDHLDIGLPVVVLDFENGKVRFVRRLRELGLRSWPEALHYLSHPALPEKPAGWAELVRQLGEHVPGALVIVDSYRSLTGHYGFEVTDPNGVEQLFQPFVKCQSLTVITLDHSRMSAKRGEKDVAAWAAAKQQLGDVVYYVEKTKPYGVNDCGELVLEVVDDRDGRLVPLRCWDIGGQGEGRDLYFHKKDHPDPPPAKDGSPVTASDAEPAI